MRFLLLLCLAGLAVGCARAESVTVFAAASLRNALDEVVKQHETKTGDRVRVSYAASSALARQIENGAPADLFISADTAWMDHLEKKGLVRSDSRIPLLRNRLALVTPAARALELRIAPQFPLAATLGAHRLAVADPAHVPAGRYARSALQSLGVWPHLSSRIAAAPDVRAALLLVARGEAPLGIVYTTDAAAEPRVRIVDSFPENTHPPIVYPAALTAASRNAAAGAFLQALNKPPARAVFDKHGFR